MPPKAAAQPQDPVKGILKHGAEADAPPQETAAAPDDKKGIRWDEESLSVTEAQRGQWTIKVTEPKTPYIHYDEEQDLVTGHSGAMAPMELTDAAVDLPAAADGAAGSQTIFPSSLGASGSGNGANGLHGVLVHRDGSHRRSSSRSSVASASSHSKSVRLSSADDDVRGSGRGDCEWDTSDDESAHRPVHDADVDLSSLTPEERAHREAFARKRQQHYNMKAALAARSGSDGE